jgi:hypothetical protein
MLRKRKKQSDHIYYALLWQGVMLYCALYHLQQTMQKYRAKITLLSQIITFWLFFIEFTRSHTKHRWSWSSSIGGGSRMACTEHFGWSTVFECCEIEFGHTKMHMIQQSSKVLIEENDCFWLVDLNDWH